MPLISGRLLMDEIAKRKIGEKVSLVGTALEETIHLLEVHHAKGTPDVEPLLEKAKSALRIWKLLTRPWPNLTPKRAVTRHRHPSEKKPRATAQITTEAPLLKHRRTPLRLIRRCRVLD